MAVVLSDWRPVVPISPKTLITGERVSAELLMYRDENGKRVYRRPTEQEAFDYMSGEAW